MTVQASANLLLLLIVVGTICGATQRPFLDLKPGFPCETIPNFCDRVHCIPPYNCPNGVLVDGGGNCGCCQVCVTYSELGESCTGNAVEPIVFDETFVGLYYKFDTCHPGLVCNNGICAPSTDEDACTHHQQVYSDNTWEVKPGCDFYGNYVPTRQKGRDTPRTFCENKDGKTIFGRIPTSSVNVSCECSRLVDQLMTENNELYTNIRCDEMGDFTSLQCWKGLCFCVDPYTRQMTTGVVPIAGMAALPCYNVTIYNTTFYTPCQNETYKMDAIIGDLGIKGVNMDHILLQLPICDMDGSYAPVQYDGNTQFCTDKSGNQLGSYVIYLQGAPDPTMDCKCARDSFFPDELPNSYRFDDCASSGNYNPSYVVIDQFYCLDSDGQQDSDVLETANISPAAACGTAAPTPNPQL